MEQITAAVHAALLSLGAAASVQVDGPGRLSIVTEGGEHYLVTVTHTP